MNEPKPQPSPAELDEDDVAAFLLAQPQFLSRHPEVLDVLEVHHEAGPAVSLIERQVAGLRRTNQQTQARLNELIATARENELRVQHLNGLAGVLIGADSPAALVKDLRAFLHRELAVDALFIGIVGGPEVAKGGIQALARDGAAKQALTNVFRRGKPLCGPVNDAQAAALFAEAGDTPPQSSAMVPLGEPKVRGALVLGSRDPKRFTPEMGTLFLALMGHLVTAACRRQLGASKL